MYKAITDIIQLIAEEKIKWIDLRFTDTLGKEQHVSVAAKAFNENKFTFGHVFDGSSIAGWKEIELSDMLLFPDVNTAWIDPFYEQKTLVLSCDVYDPHTGAAYERDPRSIAKRAEAYLKTTGLGDHAYFGPEPEFFIFDSVNWHMSAAGCSVNILSEEAPWSSNTVYPQSNSGHRPANKGGYFSIPPVDSFQNIRSEIAILLEQLGIPVEVHHHEVASAGQNEIGTRFSTLVKRADWTQIFKYIVWNVAQQYGKTATFMPKPIVGDNGSGMHIHQSIWRSECNLFAGDAYAGLSEFALYYLGGILHHALALSAFTNPTVNSYKRLVPGFEAPVYLAYSANNRSAAIRIPYSAEISERRIEVRFPDALANSYLAFSALLMAGLDGVQKKRHPGAAIDKNLYQLSQQEAAAVPLISSNLTQALNALDQNREFLIQGGVFSHSMIDAYLHLKQQEITRFNNTVHPLEFSLYYSL